MCKNVQKRASQIFLDPIQKRAPVRSVQLEAVYLEALLYWINDAQERTGESNGGHGCIISHAFSNLYH